MKKYRIFAIVLVLMLLAFIWGNSCLSREVSQNASLKAGGILRPFLELFVGMDNVTDHLVRKLAHFTEFAALGFSLGQLAYVYDRRGWWNGSYLFLCGMAAAVTDESIQLFSDGRGAQVQDVLLDCSGVAAGLLAAGLFFFLLLPRCRKSKCFQRFADISTK